MLAGAVASSSEAKRDPEGPALPSSSDEEDSKVGDLRNLSLGVSSGVGGNCTAEEPEGKYLCCWPSVKTKASSKLLFQIGVMAGF